MEMGRASVAVKGLVSVEKCYGPLAPEQARLGMLATLQGAQDGVGIDEVRLHVPDDIAALEAWRAQVATAVDGQARETVDHAPAST